MTSPPRTARLTTHVAVARQWRWHVGGNLRDAASRCPLDDRKRPSRRCVRIAQRSAHVLEPHRRARGPLHAAAHACRTRSEMAAGAKTRMLQVLVPTDATGRRPSSPTGRTLGSRPSPRRRATGCDSTPRSRCRTGRSSTIRRADPRSRPTAGTPRRCAEARCCSRSRSKGATYVRVDGVTLVTTATPGTITIDRSNGALQVHADGAAPNVAATALGFTPHAVDAHVRARHERLRPRTATAAEHANVRLPPGRQLGAGRRRRQ